MRTLSIIAPSIWASAIINCDYSGLGDDDIKAINTFMAINGLAFADCIGVESKGFCKSHSAWNQMPLAADCNEYIFKI